MRLSNPPSLRKQPSTESNLKANTSEFGVVSQEDPAVMSPICESPTSEKSFSASEALVKPSTDAPALPPRMSSAAHTKSSGWRRGSASSRKPSGLASALAASGLAMVNPAMQAPPIPGHTSPPRSDTGRATSDRQPSVGSFQQGHHGRSSIGGRSGRSSERGQSPVSNQGRNGGVHSSDGHSEYLDDPANYSGLEDSDEEDSSNSDDYLSDDLPPHDIPVTGFAVASNKRNADFHELFPGIPEGDYLIEDYGCALQREILIQGRLYISENHICFHANIFGWITDTTIPIYEITSLEKKMTAFVIPNAIQISTRQDKHTFASFLARDTAFDVMYNIWKLARPEDMDPGMPTVSEPDATPSVAAQTSPSAKVAVAKVTRCSCSTDGTHYPNSIIDITLPGTPERIYNLIFASGFIKDFMRDNQKLMDIQISDWAPMSLNSQLLMRNMSYIKPLNGSVGPKQTKCEIKDETIHCDFEDYVVMLTTTRTPDVPSGGVFSVKTRTCIMWAGANSTKVVVTTQVEWTGRSFIKGIIEKSCLDGQKTYHTDLEKAVRGYIAEHRSEFIPEGVEIEEEAAPAAAETAEVQKEEVKSAKEREKERNQRSLQWAWDTFDGASQVARRSTRGLLELLKDAWDQSSLTTILIFFIVFLLLSNIYTMSIVSSGTHKTERTQVTKPDDRDTDKLIHSVVAAIREEKSTLGRDPHLFQSSRQDAMSLPQTTESFKSEMDTLLDTLVIVEQRLGMLKQHWQSLHLECVD